MLGLLGVFFITICFRMEGRVRAQEVRNVAHQRQTASADHVSHVSVISSVPAGNAQYPVANGSAFPLFYAQDVQVPSVVQTAPGSNYHSTVLVRGPSADASSYATPPAGATTVQSYSFNGIGNNQAISSTAYKSRNSGAQTLRSSPLAQQDNNTPLDNTVTSSITSLVSNGGGDHISHETHVHDSRNNGGEVEHHVRLQVPNPEQGIHENMYNIHQAEVGVQNTSTYVGVYTPNTQTSTAFPFLVNQESLSYNGAPLSVGETPWTLHQGEKDDKNDVLSSTQLHIQQGSVRSKPLSDNEQQVLTMLHANTQNWPGNDANKQAKRSDPSLQLFEARTLPNTSYQGMHEVQQFVAPRDNALQSLVRVNMAPSASGQASSPPTHDDHTFRLPKAPTYEEVAALHQQPEIPTETLVQSTSPDGLYWMKKQTLIPVTVQAPEIPSKVNGDQNKAFNGALPVALVRDNNVEGHPSLDPSSTNVQNYVLNRMPTTMESQLAPSQHTVMSNVTVADGVAGGSDPGNHVNVQLKSNSPSHQTAIKSSFQTNGSPMAPSTVMHHMEALNGNPATTPLNASLSRATPANTVSSSSTFLSADPLTAVPLHAASSSTVSTSVGPPSTAFSSAKGLGTAPFSTVSPSGASSSTTVLDMSRFSAAPVSTLQSVTHTAAKAVNESHDVSTPYLYRIMTNPGMPQDNNIPTYVVMENPSYARTSQTVINTDNAVKVPQMAMLPSSFKAPSSQSISTPQSSSTTIESNSSSRGSNVNTALRINGESQGPNVITSSLSHVPDTTTTMSPSVFRFLKRTRARHQNQINTTTLENEHNKGNDTMKWTGWMYRWYSNGPHVSNETSRNDDERNHTGFNNGRSEHRLFIGDLRPAGSDPEDSTTHVVVMESLSVQDLYVGRAPDHQGSFPSNGTPPYDVFGDGQNSSRTDIENATPLSTGLHFSSFKHQYPTDTKDQKNSMAPLMTIFSNSTGERSSKNANHKDLNVTSTVEVNEDHDRQNEKEKDTSSIARVSSRPVMSEKNQIYDNQPDNVTSVTHIASYPLVLDGEDEITSNPTDSIVSHSELVLEDAMKGINDVYDDERRLQTEEFNSKSLSSNPKLKLNIRPTRAQKKD